VKCHLTSALVFERLAHGFKLVPGGTDDRVQVSNVDRQQDTTGPVVRHGD
jgi:hypothetical protein